jgi:hypothetical protein
MEGYVRQLVKSLEEDMSLLDEAMETCVLLNRQTALDEYGGFINTWVEAVEFKAAIVFDTSIEARTAEAQGVTSMYTVTTPRKLSLQYHDVFRRTKDGKLFRVTSDGDDKYTPGSATLDMRQVTAEELDALPV